jgi:hypothetical protein
MRIRQNKVPKLFKKKIAIIAMSAGLVFPLALGAATFGLNDIPSDFVFNKTLRQGDTVSPDVSFLQFILNQSSDTRVAETGGGSLTGLTNFFGSKTYSAVVRFQEKYRDEILTPANITNPTGVVGENTRKKLNQILASLFSGTFIESNSTTPLKSSLSSSAANSGTKIFTSSISNTPLPNNQSTVKRPPIISSFSTFKAQSGQLMSLFGAQFHPNKNTVYLGSEKIGDYAGLDNGTKITFQVPASLETGLYEAAVVNSYGTTSTGSMFLSVVKPATSTSTATRNFAPSLTTVYPNNSRNMNDLIFLYGENFSFNNTIETNLGTTVVRSTNRKTLSFMISELPYYMEAFKKYKGQSINVLIKIRNENGLSKEQLVHVINFPNTDSPTINTTAQMAPASFGLGSTTDDAAEMAFQRDLDRLNTSLSTFSYTSTSSRNSTSSVSSTSTRSNSTNSAGTGNGNSSDTSSTNSSNMQLDPATQQLGQILGGSMLVQTVMQTSPVHKFVLEPLVGGGSSGGGSSGGSSLLGGAGGALGGSMAGGSGGSSGGTGGGSGGVTFFGGQITQVTYCTCSGAILLAIRDIPSKQTLQVFYRYGQSTLHANYNIFTTGINVIGGLTQGGGACEVYSGNSCSTQGNAQYTIDTIRGVGTGSTPS